MGCILKDKKEEAMQRALQTAFQEASQQVLGTRGRGYLGVRSSEEGCLVAIFLFEGEIDGQGPDLLDLTGPG